MEKDKTSLPSGNQSHKTNPATPPTSHYLVRVLGKKGEHNQAFLIGFYSSLLYSLLFSGILLTLLLNNYLQEILLLSALLYFITSLIPLYLLKLHKHPNETFDSTETEKTINHIQTKMDNEGITPMSDDYDSSDLLMATPMNAKQKSHRNIKGYPSITSLKENQNHTDINKLTVLVADDNGTSRTITSKMLTFGGYKVDTAADGKQALDMLEKKHYDLMVLDLHMPHYGGLDVMKIHRAAARKSQRTPVIILTADTSVEAIHESQDAGSDACLSKPVDTNTLLDTVYKLISEDRKTRILPLPWTSSVSLLTTDSLPKIDQNVLKRLKELAGHDHLFLHTVIHGFVSETEKSLQSMQSYLSSGQYSEFKEMAHIMTGSAGNIGANELHNICRTMMQIDRKTFDNNAQNLIDQAKCSYQSTKKLLLADLKEPEL